MSQQSPGRRRSHTGAAAVLSTGVPMSGLVTASGMRPWPPVNGITGPGRQAVTGTTEPAWAPRPLPFTLPDAKLLASNALRHGRPPVCPQLTTRATWWLLDVSDAAPDRPPAPATDRDPADGGLRLHLVAPLCGSRGWTVTAGRTHVWARIDLTRPEAPGVVPQLRSGR